jgi:hypothetical protein
MKTFIIEKENLLVIVTEDNIDVIKPGLHKIYNKVGECVFMAGFLDEDF